MPHRPDARVLVCEGEKSADAAAGVFPGYAATTSPGGCKAASNANWTPLAGRVVTIWPDADEPGAKYVAEVTSVLQVLGCDVSIINVMALAVIVPDGGTREVEQRWDAAGPNPIGTGRAAQGGNGTR